MEHNRCPINACPLACSVAEPRERPDYYRQKQGLVALKRRDPCYGEVHSQVLQEMVRRVRLTFERFLQGDSYGKRSGKPRFKGQNRYRTFTFPQADGDWLTGKRIKLPKIGAVKFVRHRRLPKEFKVKTVSVTHKADGWYVTLTLENSSVPDTPKPDLTATQANSIGVDAGLDYFVACSDGTLREPPQFYRRAEKQLATLQAKRTPDRKGQSLAGN